MADRVITDRMVADHRLSQISTASSTNSKRAKAHVGPWQLGRTLGRGSSGRVRLAKHMETGKLAAVKIVPKAQTSDSQTGKASESYGIEREVIIMKLIEHPNIMGLFDVWENKGESYLVLEYIEGGESFDYLISRGRLSEREAVHYFRQICYGVDYCHSFNICHRDLKPENSLLDKHRNIKIADFGMAALEANGRLLETSCGSPHYASPEIVSGKTYHGAPSDIWSCGIILFALLTGHLPFDDDNIRQLLSKVQEGKFTMPSSLSSEARDSISRMLVVDPMQRICMRDILNHPLLRRYPPRYIPAENVGRKMPRSDVSQRIGHIDREILRNLQTLWPHTPRETSISQLRQQSPNTEKIFYALLVRFRQRHGSSSRDSIPRNKSVASVKSMRSSKSMRSIASLNSKAGSMKSLKSVRSSRSARSIMSTRRRRSPMKHVSAGAAGKHKSSHSKAAAGTKTGTTTGATGAGATAPTATSTAAASNTDEAGGASANNNNNNNMHSADENADLFAQILDQAFNSNAKGPQRAPTTRIPVPARTARPTTAAAHMINYTRRVPDPAQNGVQTNYSAGSNNNTNLSSPRKKVTTSAVPSTVATSAVSPLRNIAAPGPLPQHIPNTEASQRPYTVPQAATAAPPNINRTAMDHLKSDDYKTKSNSSFTKDAFEASNMDFDFSNSSFGSSVPSEQNYLLPMIFEEDRFADAIEEEMEQKIYNHGMPQNALRQNNGSRGQPGDDSQLRITNLVAGESFLSYQPSPAAAAIGAPARPAPKAPNGPRAMPSRKPVPIYMDGSGSNEDADTNSENDSTETRKPLAPSEETSVKRSSKANEDKSALKAASQQKSNAEVMETLKIPKRDERAPAARASTDSSSSAQKDKPKMSWIRRSTPRIVSRKSSNNSQKAEESKSSTSAVSASSAPVVSSSKTAHTMGSTNTRPSSAPSRSRPAQTVVDKENVSPHQKERITPPSVERARAHNADARAPGIPQVEEPRQNWFMKMSSSSAQSSGRIMKSSCESIESRAIILEILNEWTPHGSAIYNDGARGEPIVVAVLRNNSLRLKAARISIDIKSSSSSTSTAKSVSQKGSRTSFGAFSNEMSRRLQDNNVLSSATN